MTFDTYTSDNLGVEHLIKITIITVCRNSEKTISRTIDSVVAQNFSNLEYIIIDGGSLDNTCQIISKKMAHVDKFISEPDNGIYDAMNKGINLATGDVIGFLNSDDFYFSSDVLNQIGRLFSEGDIDSCYGDLCYFDPANIKENIRYWKSGNYVRGSFARGWVPPHPTFFVKRSILEQYGQFDLSFPIAADFDLMARLLEKHGISSKYISETLVKMSTGGASDTGIKGLISQNLEILRALKKNQLPIRLLSFVSHKLISRLTQVTRLNSH